MQKYIYLKHNYEVDRTTDTDSPPDQEITLSWFRTIIVTGYPMMTSDQRRLFSSIYKKMNKARDDKADYLPLTQIEIIFIKTALDKGLSKAEHSPFITTAEQALLDATDTIPSTPDVTAPSKPE